MTTKATWWQTLTGDGKAMWNRMDGAEHVGYERDMAEDYDGDDKFIVFKGTGRRSNCDNCPHHRLDPDDFLGYAPTEHEAAMLVQEYCENAADVVEWTGRKPIHRRGANHPRAKVMWA